MFVRRRERCAPHAAPHSEPEIDGGAPSAAAHNDNPNGDDDEEVCGSGGGPCRRDGRARVRRQRHAVRPDRCRRVVRVERRRQAQRVFRRRHRGAESMGASGHRGSRRRREGDLRADVAIRARQRRRAADAGLDVLAHRARRPLERAARQRDARPAIRLHDRFADVRLVRRCVPLRRSVQLPPGAVLEARDSRQSHRLVRLRPVGGFEPRAELGQVHEREPERARVRPDVRFRQSGGRRARGEQHRQRRPQVRDGQFRARRRLRRSQVSADEQRARRAAQLGARRALCTVRVRSEPAVHEHAQHADGRGDRRDPGRRALRRRAVDDRRELRVHEGQRAARSQLRASSHGGRAVCAVQAHVRVRRDRVPVRGRQRGRACVDQRRDGARCAVELAFAVSRANRHAYPFLTVSRPRRPPRAVRLRGSGRAARAPGRPEFAGCAGLARGGFRTRRHGRASRAGARACVFGQVAAGACIARRTAPCVGWRT
ncbi:hypothetical protein BURPS1710b_0262 [Burkholderia pseudomallei 1710b]|uniref:Uncharacterized protein n=1 Tax=Burkholderia pseudomallei (strain 1710b) TaxID=320372 RepID=Q3JXM6_BURP1|nr:hypothetical protein BURPS1710b_0262 [Burkholderia pseudomallei 1710b]